MKCKVPFTWGLERRWGMRFVHGATIRRLGAERGLLAQRAEVPGGGGFGHVAESLSGHAGARHEKSNTVAPGYKGR